MPPAFHLGQLSTHFTLLPQAEDAAEAAGWCSPLLSECAVEVESRKMS